MICDRLQTALPPIWDGRQAVVYMRENGCKNWKQMEWHGFYFQFECERILSDVMNIPGPKYKNVIFDGGNEIPWDFKAHAVKDGQPVLGNVPTNGYEETCAAIRDYGEVGFIVACGKAVYDTDGSFKHWHDELKGGISRFETERIQRGARSRKRKTAFYFDSLCFVFLNERTLPFCGRFQTDFRNSDGSLRNPKVMLNLSDHRIETYKFDLASRRLSR